MVEFWLFQNLWPPEKIFVGRVSIVSRIRKVSKYVFCVEKQQLNLDMVGLYSCFQHCPQGTFYSSLESTTSVKVVSPPEP